MSQTRAWPEVQQVFSASKTIREISKCRRKTAAFEGFHFILTCTVLELSDRLTDNAIFAGVGIDNNGVLVLGATNIPWTLDSAIRRRYLLLSR